MKKETIDAIDKVSDVLRIASEGLENIAQLLRDGKIAEDEALTNLHALASGITTAIMKLQLLITSEEE